MKEVVLEKNQQEFLKKFSSVPEWLTERKFVLFGGTALALQIGHRKSVDFDFISEKPISELEVLKSLKQILPGLVVRKKELSTLHAIWKNVRLSFFSGIRLKQVKPNVKYAGMELMSMEDIAAMKIAVIMQRYEVKDYFDIAYLLHFEKMKLSSMIKGFQKKYAKQSALFPEEMIIKSLAYTKNLKNQEVFTVGNKRYWEKYGIVGGIERILSEQIVKYVKSRIKS